MAELLTLRQVVEIFGIDCDTSKRVDNIVCPICGKGPRDKKMNLNFDRFGPDDGAFRCVRCDAHGRALQFWAMMRGLDMDDMSAAAKDYYSYKKENHITVASKKTSVQRIDVEITDVATRHATYTALLNALDLSESHRKELCGRGLSPETITRNMYRTYPAISHMELCELLLSQGFVLKGVPGFYTKKDGRWTMLDFSSGFLIPQRDGFGRIQGMQLRLDKPTSAKYLTLSTGGDYLNGAKGTTCCHMAKGSSLQSVILTEGPLKADVISSYTGMTVLGIPGVNAVHYLKRALYDLKRAGMQEIWIAFDMDLYDNIYVMRAFENLRMILNEFKIPYFQLKWDREFKGLDDFLSAKKTTS